MNPLLAIGLCALGAFEVTLSPDQPLPFSYTDDPLIVEVRSDTPSTAEIHLRATPDYNHDAAEAHFESVTLGPGDSRWYAMKGLPGLRGPWTVTVAITADGVTETIEATAYRIDRPGNTFPHPLYAYGDNFDRKALLALRSVAVDTIAVPMAHPNLPGLLASLHSMAMRALIRVYPEDLEGAQALAEAHCESVAGWILPLRGDRERLSEALEALRGFSCQKPVRVELPDATLPDLGLELVAPGQHLIISGVPVNVGALRDTLETRSLGRVVLNATLPRETGGESEPFLPLYFEFLAQGAGAVAFPVEMVYDGGALQPGLSHVNGLIHRVRPGDYGGRIRQPGTARAQIFTAGDRWVAAAWRTDDTSPIELPWSSAHPFSVMDKWGNGLESKPGEQTWTHEPVGDFVYVTGRGGPVLKGALANTAIAAARQILADGNLKSVWPEALQATLAAIEANPAHVSSRVQFFSLLRAFPEIEERWHAGQLTRPAATAALGRLARLARTLCQLEAAQGASFLEPLQDTLARCEEFQSAYLTGATTTAQARARGDWLAAEVRRLMDEAEALAQLDRRIEADAVAALAEWRARALVFAAKAGPLSDQLALPEEDGG